MFLLVESDGGATLGELAMHLIQQMFRTARVDAHNGDATPTHLSRVVIFPGVVGIGCCVGGMDICCVGQLTQTSSRMQELLDAVCGVIFPVGAHPSECWWWTLYVGNFDIRIGL